MRAVLVLPVAGPLLVAALLLAVPRRRVLHRIGGAGVTTAVLATALVLLPVTVGGTVPVTRIGGWTPLIAIGLAADPFSTLLLATTALVVLCCLACAGAGGNDSHPFFVPLVLVLSAGAYGALLTTDLFNLFVLVEVMLVPSYVLLALGGGNRRVRAGRVYVATNLLASTMLLTGVGLLYGVAGTVRIGDLAHAARDSPPAAAAAAGVVLLALAVKSAIVPLHDWLPRTYPEAPPVVAALFSGLLTKIGLYAFIRVFAVVYEGDPAYHWLLGTLAVVTMVVGVLGAVGERAMHRILSFHIVSQIGYVLLALALFTTASLTAGVFFLVQYILVKTALLLCASAVRTGHGTDRLDRLGGLGGREPLLAAAFAGAAISLVGLPPFSGFPAKFLILRAAAESADWLGLTVAVAVSLVTLASMLKIWSGVFWGAPGARSGGGVRVAVTVPVLALVVLSLLLGLAAEPLLIAAGAAAAGLTDPAGYVRAVTGR